MPDAFSFSKEKKRRKAFPTRSLLHGEGRGWKGGGRKGAAAAEEEGEKRLEKKKTPASRGEASAIPDGACSFFQNVFFFFGAYAFFLHPAYSP